MKKTPCPFCRNPSHFEFMRVIAFQGSYRGMMTRGRKRLIAAGYVKAREYHRYYQDEWLFTLTPLGRLIVADSEALQIQFERSQIQIEMAESERLHRRHH